jgi:hypothetical protein
MNRLNPLYIVGLFLTLLFISFFSLSNEKKSYFEKIDQVNQLQQKAQEYKYLTSYWKNEAFVNKTIDEIIKNSMFKNEQITKTASKDSVILKLESSNPQVLDSFLNRVLNKQLVIKKLELNKNFINLEIGIK